VCFLIDAFYTAVTNKQVQPFSTIHLFTVELQYNSLKKYVVESAEKVEFTSAITNLFRNHKPH